MALPKEPRQKMINIMYLVLTALLALNVSSEILNAFKVVNKSLETSNTNIKKSNDFIYQSLAEKASDPATREKAIYWKGKADQVESLSKEMNSYLEGLKDTLIANSDPKKGEDGKPLLDADGKQEFNEASLEAATRLFGNGPGGSNLGPKLEQKLKDYRAAMLSVDDSMGKAYEATFPIDVAKPQIGEDGKPKDFTEAFFHMTPTVAALTILSKFQNNVKNSENLLASYCHNQVGAVKIVYNKFKAIAQGSSNYLMPGEKLTVTAGVGAFNDQASPVITLGGSVVPLNADGVAVKDFDANGSGEQSIHYNIHYRKPDGSYEDIPGDIKYTVGHPSGATVSLDKENVFYIGLENPITIGSPTGMDRTQVIGKGCNVSMSGAHGTVKVSAPGDCAITVAAAGSPAVTLPFRIKRIPEPEFKVGSGKIRMPSVEFKSQQFCRADMGPDFIYDVHYNVVSATVYFSGANFSNVVTTSITGNSLAAIQNYIQRCGPGSVVSFDNVKVSGPDGQRIIEGKSIALY
jgi:gliding motility-associated protein GldM